MATTTPNFGWTVPTSTDLVKDGATAIETLGDSIDASFVDLKGGTTGQVLSKASGTDLDFAWVAQDDSNAIQNAIVDAKGDLIAATAADTPARLAVGTNGQVLTADSAEATGMKWATAASGGGLTLLETITFNNTANTYTSATIAGTYKNLRIVGQGLQESGTNAGEINLRFNGDTGANYNYAFIRNTGTTIVGRPTSGASKNEIVTCQSIALSADTSVRFGQIEISIPNYAGSNYKSVNYQCSDNSGGVSNNGVGGGTWNNTAAITSITFIEGNTANFKAGTLLIYGES